MKARSVIRPVGWILLLGFAASCAISVVRAGEPPEVQGLRSENSNDRLAARRAIMARRKELIAWLEGTIRELAATEKKATVRTAMQVLGDLRSVESVPLLADHLSFHVVESLITRIPTFADGRPAAGALIEIGLPSVGPVLDKATSSDDEKVHKIAAVVVCQIQGRKWGTVTIDERIERETDSRAKQRLSQVRKHIESGKAEKKSL
jgi:hypothetical protein